MKKALFAFLLTLFAIAAVAQVESQTEYNFLRLPVSAHAAALGGDNITLIEDDEALIFHNPALLSSVTDKTINLNYMNYMSGVNTASAAFNRVVKERASWAVSGQFIDYGKIKEVDENNIQTGEFSARDISVAGYFSYMLTNHIAGGISAKFITSYLGSYNSIGFGVDLGVNYYHPDKEWSLSLVLKNLGGQLKAYDDNYEKMPIDVQMGVSKQFSSIPLRLSATFVDLNHLDYTFSDHIVLGAEFMLTESFWIGGGYNFRRASEMKIQSSDGKSSSHRAGLSLGTGINLERFKLNLAYGKYHVSSSSVMLSLAYSL
jgi:long-subunit fatty acid transport protein